MDETNIELYVRYQNNAAVPIDSHWIGDAKRLKPLKTVGHLIVACVGVSKRQLLGLPDNHGPLTLHTVLECIESAALESDVLLSTINAGRAVRTALLIKSPKADTGHMARPGLERLEAFIQRKLTEQEERFIISYFSSRVDLIRSVKLAIELIQEIERLPHSLTRKLLREKQIDISGPFNSGSSSRSSLLMAFKSGRPMLLKIPSPEDAEKEYKVWTKLATLAIGAENLFHLVGPMDHVLFHRDSDATSFPSIESHATKAPVLRSGILMPVYPACLEQVPKPVKESTALKIWNNMNVALEAMHSTGLCHADLKSPNIFIDMAGNYFLGDYGATAVLGEDLHKFSSSHWPHNSISAFKASKGIDHWLLIITILEKLGEVNVAKEFSLSVVIKVMEQVRDVELKECFAKSWAQVLEDGVFA